MNSKDNTQFARFVRLVCIAGAEGGEKAIKPFHISMVNCQLQSLDDFNKADALLEAIRRPSFKFRLEISELKELRRIIRGSR